MDVPSIESFDFFERNKSSCGFKMPSAHFHEHNELYFLIDGKTKYFVGSELYILVSGDFVFIPKGEYHQTDSEGVGRERVLIAFEDALVFEQCKPYIDELQKNKHGRIPKDRQRAFISLFRRIAEETQTPDAHSERMKRFYLNELLVLLCRHRQMNIPEELSGTNKLIQDAARYISANYASEISLESLSERYSISPSYFSKLFKRVTGVGLNEYIAISRVSAAQEMLILGNMSITEVALACGFNDSSYFTQVFKKITGLTPKKYAAQQ